MLAWQESLTHNESATDCAAICLDRYMRLANFTLAGLLVSMFMVVSAQAEDETHYSVHKRDDYPDFWSSIERVGPCAVPGEPTDDVVIPWEKFYPPESRRKNEMGRVVVRIIFDADSCPRSAMVLRSSGFPLLDEATLRFAIQAKTTKRTKTVDGQPSLILPITWKLAGVPSH
jgi:TonB family protein